jgi:TP901 family phage tail tape measure protein
LGSGGAIAQAAVELVADGSKFPASVRTALAGAAKTVQTAGQQHGQSYATGFWGKVKNIAQYVGIRDAVQLGFGAIASGIKDVIQTGVAYQGEMNNLGAVTHASASQMAAASQLAQALGRDMRFPGVTAKDAAAAMLDLANAGFNLTDSMRGAPAVLNLTTAAGLDTAMTARIVGDSLDIWHLKMDQSSKTADIFASAVHNTSGGLTEFFTAIKYAGPAAAAMGINMHDTSTAIAEMGRSGIIGSMAGTTLRSMLVSLTKPSKQASEALKELGVRAFDEQGQFVGMRSVIDQLSAAHGRLTQQQFNSAAAAAFGKTAVSGVLALTEKGTQGWDQMSAALAREGEASALAQAKTVGFGAVLGNLHKVGADVALQIYQAVSPALTSIGTSLIKGLQDVGPLLAGVLRPVMGLFGLLANILVSVLSPALTLLKPLFVALAAVMNSPVFRLFAAMITGAAAAFIAYRLAMDADLLVVAAWELATKAAAAAQWLLNAAMDANPIGIIIVAIGALVAGFIYLWNSSSSFRLFWIGLWHDVQAIFAAVVAWLVGAFKSVTNFLGQWGPAILAVLLPFIGIPLLIIQHWGAIASFFSALPGKIGSFLASLPGVVGNALLTALKFGLNAVVQGLEWIIAEIIVFPAQVVWVLAKLGVLLWDLLTAAFTLALNAVIAGANWIIAFVPTIPGRIVAGIASLAAMLVGWASSAWSSAVTATAAAAAGIWNWAMSLPGRVVAAVGALGSMLWGWASSAWSSAVSGTVAAAGALWGFVGSIPGRILGALGNVGRILWDAGQKIIQGFLDGLKAAASAVWSFISGIGSKIASLKGPLDYDKTLLIPAGHAIIGGLNTGLQSEFATVRDTLRGFTREIPTFTVPIRAEASLMPSSLTSPELAAAARTANAYTAANGSTLAAWAGQGAVTVNAPIQITTQATDPYLIARMTQDALTQFAQV